MLFKTENLKIKSNKELQKINIHHKNNLRFFEFQKSKITYDLSFTPFIYTEKGSIQSKPT